MRILFTFSLFLILFIIPGCKGAFDRALPEKCPSKITIEMHDGGGMAPEGNSYYFSKDSCYAKFWRDKTTNILNFKLDSIQIDHLYHVFYENYFEQIKTKQMETYDRGGISITLRFDDKNINVEDAGSTYIAEGWYKNFNAIVKAMQDIVGPIVEKSKAPLVVMFDKNILQDSLSMYFNVENFSYNTDSGRKETARFQLMKGMHSYYVTLLHNTQPAYQRKIKTSYEGVTSVCGEGDTLFISLQDTVHIISRKNVECGN